MEKTEVNEEESSEEFMNRLGLTRDEYERWGEYWDNFFTNELGLKKIHTDYIENFSPEKLQELRRDFRTYRSKGYNDEEIRDLLMKNYIDIEFGPEKSRKMIIGILALLEKLPKQFRYFTKRKKNTIYYII